MYVADSTGADVHEVAAGLRSPSLDAFGNLYALDGTSVDVFAPGAGRQATIPTGAAAPTELAVAPYGGRLAVTDGTPLAGPTTLDVISRSGAPISAITNGFGGYWIGPLGLTASVVNQSGNALVFNHVILDNGLFRRPLWFPDTGVPAPGIAAALEYAPNPQRTEAAVVIFVGAPGNAGEELVLIPISSSLAPTAGGATTLPSCAIGDDFQLAPGNSFAWSPDGTAIAFTTQNGIATATIGSTFSSDCSQVGPEQLVIPDGVQPSWGPSDSRNFPAPG